MRLFKISGLGVFTASANAYQAEKATAQYAKGTGDRNRGCSVSLYPDRVHFGIPVVKRSVHIKKKKEDPIYMSGRSPGNMCHQSGQPVKGIKNFSDLPVWNNAVSRFY